MRFRTARKVVDRWSRGLGNYTWNKYGSVIAAHKKLESYYARRKDLAALAALPGLPYDHQTYNGAVSLAAALTKGLR